MIKTLKDLQGLDAEKVARAIEADAGQGIPGRLGSSALCTRRRTSLRAARAEGPRDQ
jgi:hypothetical protein